MFRITQKRGIAVAAAAVAISLGAMAGTLGGSGRFTTADGAAGTAVGAAIGTPQPTVVHHRAWPSKYQNVSFS